MEGYIKYFHLAALFLSNPHVLRYEFQVSVPVSSLVYQVPYSKMSAKVYVGSVSVFASVSLHWLLLPREELD